MSDLPLFKKIQILRQFFRQNPTFGKLTNEKFLTFAGDYIGHQFCFERGEASWKFDSQIAEVTVAGHKNQILVESLFDESTEISAAGNTEISRAA